MGEGFFETCCFLCVPPTAPHKSHIGKVHLDSKSKITYTPHLVTCSFTRIKCVPETGHHGRQELVAHYPNHVAVATTVLVELGYQGGFFFLRLMCAS